MNLPACRDGLVALFRRLFPPPVRTAVAPPPSTAVDDPATDGDCRNRLRTALGRRLRRPPDETDLCFVAWTREDRLVQSYVCIFVPGLYLTMLGDPERSEWAAVQSAAQLALTAERIVGAVERTPMECDADWHHRLNVALQRRLRRSPTKDELDIKMYRTRSPFNALASICVSRLRMFIEGPPRDSETAAVRSVARLVWHILDEIVPDPRP
jgi:hypothetical protein